MEIIKDYTLDDLDMLIILAIGKKGNSSKRIRKTVIELSKLLNIKIDCIDNYCEDIAERLNSMSRVPFWIKINYRYRLTELGRKTYDIIIEKLKERKREDILKILNEFKNKS